MRNFFPILEECVYLNTAYTAPLASPLLAWRQQDEQAYLNKADRYKLENEKQYIVDAEQRLALFSGAEVGHAFVTTNFSVAFHHALTFLPSNAHFLLLEEEYPSLLGTVQSMGFTSTVIKVTHDVEATVFSTLAQHPIDVLAISMVQYSSGILFDLDLLKKIKAAFPEVLILVDVTQYLGAELFSLSETPIDAIFGSTYKWLMAGHGTGFAVFQSSFFTHVHKDLVQIREVYNRGQCSVSAVGSLAFMLDVLSQQDVENLLLQKDRLAMQLRQGLLQRNLLDSRVAQRSKHSSIYTFNATEEVFHRLLERNIRCIQRGMGIRVSVHHYNNADDLTQFFVALDASI